MAATLVFLSGFETQDFSPWDSVSATPPVISTSVKRNGGAALGFTTGAANRVGRTMGGTVAVARCALRMNSLPVGASPNIIQAGSPLGGGLQISLNTSGVLRAQSTPPSPGTNGALVQFGSLTIGQWYVIDVRMDVSTTSWTLEWTVDGVAQTTSTGAATAASTLDTLWFGHGTASLTSVGHFIDDVAISTTSADYPIGDGKCLIYVPNAVGTHNLASGDFDDDAAAAITAGDTTSYSKLAYNPVVMTSYLEQLQIASTHYLEYGFENSAEASAPQAVQAIAMVGEGTSGTNQVEFHVRDGSSETTIFAGNPPTPAAAKKLCMTTKPSGGAWTLTALNGLLGRIGYSTDATPAPRVYGLALEADYPASGTTTILIDVTEAGVGSDFVGQPSQQTPGVVTSWKEGAL